MQVEHWYRHRAQVENLFRDAKHGAGLHPIHDPSNINFTRPRSAHRLLADSGLSTRAP